MPQGQSPLDAYRSIFRAHDWESTALGRSSDWPLLLRRSTDLLLDTSQPSFMTWGEDDCVLFNGAFARWFGPNFAASLGRPFAQLWGSAWETVAPFFASARAGRGVLAEELAIPSLSKEQERTRYVTVSYAPLRGSESQVAGVIGICTDVTERVRAKARLETEHERLMQLLEDAPGFVGKMSIPDFRFVAANRAYRKLVGDREVLGRSIVDALPDFAAQGIADILEQVRVTGEPFVGRALAMQLANPGGDETRVVDVVCAPLKDQDGGVEAIIVAGHDVTEHVRSAARVEELQNELIHLSRVSAMGTMASTLGHELNQPLTAIVNYASVARRSIPEGASAQADEALEAIAENALRAGRLIRSVRTMSRKGATAQARFPVLEAVNESIKLSGLACANPIAVRVPRGLQAFGDRVQIEQVLINLIRNACEAAAGTAGSAVSVEARRAGGKALITVSDNGPGIPFDPIEKVFAPFMSTKADGIGIGLPISRTIAEAHGGRLWAENRKQGGACFQLELPSEGPSATAD